MSLLLYIEELMTNLAVHPPVHASSRPSTVLCAILKTFEHKQKQRERSQTWRWASAAQVLLVTSTSSDINITAH